MPNSNLPVNRLAFLQRTAPIFIAIAAAVGGAFSVAVHIFDLWSHSTLVQAGFVGIVFVFLFAFFFVISKRILPRLARSTRADLALWGTFCVIASFVILGILRSFGPDFTYQPQPTLKITAQSDITLDSQESYLRLLEIKTDGGPLDFSEMRWEDSWVLDGNTLLFAGTNRLQLPIVSPEASINPSISYLPLAQIRARRKYVWMANHNKLT
jgi:hypothetical protein